MPAVHDAVEGVGVQVGSPSKMNQVNYRVKVVK